ncbi:hypothetical protein EK21DRAFT_84368 [Setomelanomma holmii]|uniref:Uncharacterized protein n=1 Tax=Setomelanomma holmii TaxID=210430 RepID=A0A9P4LTP0_9PLEO|nr:hypothetical protein EK21DRAFT_84368 [Setomelanomma holmii]
MTHWTVPPSSCNVKTLELQGYSLDGSAFAQMLSCVKSLESLNYLHDDSTSSRDPSCLGLSWEIVGQALQPHKMSLKKLRLEDLTNVDDYVRSQPTRTPSEILGSMCDFPQLRDVSAPLHAFITLRGDNTNLAQYLPVTPRPSHLSKVYWLAGWIQSSIGQCQEDRHMLSFGSLDLYLASRKLVFVSDFRLAEAIP